MLKASVAESQKPYNSPGQTNLYKLQSERKMNTEAATSYVSGLFRNLNLGRGYLYGGEGPSVSHTAWDHHHHNPNQHVIISNTEPVVIGVHEEEAVPLVRAKTKGVAFNDGDDGG
jgi:hypothetical protein